jgi:hypothetical protein
MVARVAAVVLAVLSAVVNLMFIAAFPLWAGGHHHRRHRDLRGRSTRTRDEGLSPFYDSQNGRVTSSCRVRVGSFSRAVSLEPPRGSALAFR